MLLDTTILPGLRRGVGCTNVIVPRGMPYGWVQGLDVENVNGYGHVFDVGIGGNVSGSNDTLDLLGKALPDGVGRDAIHISVAPVVAAHIVKAGEHVGWVDQEANTVGRVPDKLGIVDPFLPEGVPILPGTRIFILLYPKTITSLRHVWSHPAFAEEAKETTKEIRMTGPPMEASREWLEQFCDRIGPGYIAIMAAARNHVQNGDTYEYLIIGENAYGDIPPEFWTHYEIVTREPVPPYCKAKYFSCAC